jgi:alanine racemase
MKRSTFSSADPSSTRLRERAKFFADYNSARVISPISCALAARSVLLERDVVSRPIVARIDLAALEHNLSVARAAAGRAQILAVVKANAYGHGLQRVCTSLQGADGLAVLDIGDALSLRQFGYAKRIILLEGFFARDELALLAVHRLTPVVHSEAQAMLLRELPNDASIDVFLKVNSGMNRLGFAVAQASAVINTLRSMTSVREIVLMSHFSDAESPGGVDEQWARLQALLSAHSLPTSFANSAALLRHPQTRGDFVRPGIMLYGASPFDDRNAASLDLRPVMTLESELIAVQTLAPGDSIGYGGRFRASAPMRIGVVAAGYADGYPRHAPDGTPIRVAGVPTRTVGRVSMDLLCVDITGIAQAGVGSPVTLWGAGLPVEEVASAAGTVSYELLCALAPRVPVVTHR